MRAALQRIGILRESGHEHFNGSIVVPLWLAPGPADGSPADGKLADNGFPGTPRHVAGAYARKINDNLRAGTPMHLYLPGPHRGVLNGEGLQGHREVILCEAILDALTFWAAGYRNVTSCYGVNGLTDELVARLKACDAERMLIAFDRDDAGDRGAEAVAKRLMAEGLECYRLLFPKGMDANAYACAVKPAEKSLGVVIRSGQWMGRGVKPAKASRLPSAEAERGAAIPASSPRRPAEPAVESSPLAAETNTVSAERIVAVEEHAAKKEALPAPIQANPVLPEPEAAAVPAGPSPEPKDDAGCTADEQQLLVAFGERRYRVRGMPKQLTEALKVNVLVTCSGAEELTPAAAAEAGLHVDTLDLYQAKARAAFAKLASLELSIEESVIQHDLGRLLLKLEQVIDERARAAERAERRAAPGDVRR